MPDETNKRAEFKERLEAEVQRILDDPSFLRAPVISRLLRYLSNQAVRPEPVAVTQFSIAVDGLGRREDYDQDAESYVRVQISRLRRSLAEYYTRNKPGDDLCVFLRQGDYTLRLGSPERAYPEQNRPSFLIQPAADRSPPPPPVAQERQKGGTSFWAILGVATILVAVWGAIWTLSDLLKGSTPISGPPRVNVAITGVANGSNELARVSEMAVRKSLAASMVSRASTTGSPDYQLLMTFSNEGGGPTDVFLRLSDANDYVLYAQSITTGDDPERFGNIMGATLAELFSSTGLVAKNLLSEIPDRNPRTAFECFLITEADLADGSESDETLRWCVNKFPENQFTPFWFARLAQLHYQKAAAAGRPIRRNVDGWEYLVKAFVDDRYNSYANAIAAKIELAEGDCQQARFYLERAQSRGISNPQLYSALTVDALPCFTDPEERKSRERGLAYLISSHPDSGPRQLVYLVLAGLELGNADQAHAMLEKAIARPPKDSMIEHALNTLDRALESSSAGRPNRDEVRRAISPFVWNPAAQAQILAALPS